MRRNVKEKYRRKQKRKSPRNNQETTTGRRPKNEPKSKVASPMVAGDHGCMVAGDPGNPGRRISAERKVFSKLTMAALLTVTFDENKYQVMLQEKQSKGTFKRPASY
ncbi:hypothetical protein AAC387_Pa10g0581 [Persea americana]